MLLASAGLAVFMLSLAGASWALAVRRYEREYSWSEWDTAAKSPNVYRDVYIGPYSADCLPPVDESEWDADELQGPLVSWDEDDGAAVPGDELRRFLRSIWQKVAGDG